MRRYDGLRRLAFAALSAGLDGLSGRAARASGEIIASGYHNRPVRIALALAKAFLRSSDRAAAVAFPKAPA